MMKGLQDTVEGVKCMRQMVDPCPLTIISAQVQINKSLFDRTLWKLDFVAPTPRHKCPAQPAVFKSPSKHEIQISGSILNP